MVLLRCPLKAVCNHGPVASRRMEWAVAAAMAGGAGVRRRGGAHRWRFAEAWAVPLLSFTPQVTAGAWVSALLLRGAGPAAVAATARAALAVAAGPSGGTVPPAARGGTRAAGPDGQPARRPGPG